MHEFSFKNENQVIRLQTKHYVQLMVLHVQNIPRPEELMKIVRWKVSL